jgi:hypothetical protein
LAKICFEIPRFLKLFPLFGNPAFQIQGPTILVAGTGRCDLERNQPCILVLPHLMNTFFTAQSSGRRPSTHTWLVDISVRPSVRSVFFLKSVL